MAGAEIDVGALRQLYAADASVKAVMDHVASRKYNSDEITVDRVQAILSRDEMEVRRWEVVAAFKELAKLGIGDFIIGRRGQPSRFQWRVSMIRAGKAAQGS